jgi:membrane protein implicated in regulation of membrane protease activity
MENLIAFGWVLLGIILIVAETLTVSFFLLWFGIGALAAALVGFLGFGIIWQFLAFAVVSGILTALSRTIFVNYFAHTEHGEELKTGVDALPGQVGTVVNASQGALSEGAVKVFGSVWTAYPIEGETQLEAGERVEVVYVKGSSLYVRRFTAHLGWRTGHQLGKTDDENLPKLLTDEKE